MIEVEVWESANSYIKWGLILSYVIAWTAHDDEHTNVMIGDILKSIRVRMSYDDFTLAMAERYG
jgi:hypothetical protein